MALKAPFTVNHKVGVGRGYTIQLTLKDSDDAAVTPSRVVYAVALASGTVSVDSANGVVNGTGITIASGVVTIKFAGYNTDAEAEGTYSHDAVMVVGGDERDLLIGSLTIVPRNSSIPS